MCMEGVHHTSTCTVIYTYNYGNYYAIRRYLINKCISPPGGISFCRTLIRLFIAMWITGLSNWLPGDDFGLDLELGLVFGLDLELGLVFGLDF